MKRIILVCSLLGLVAGLFFRFFLIHISFEYDELFTAVTSNPMVAFPQLWTTYLMIDVHPPLHNFILWLWNHVMPYGPEWSLRLPSLILALGALVQAWVLFPRYLGKTARWLFLLLLSANFYLILYAQHARAYSLIVCAAVPFTFLYIKLARRLIKHCPIATKYWCLYGALAAILCWSHYFGALCFGLFSMMLGCLAWYHKRPLKPLIYTSGLVLGCFLPWMIPNLIENLGQHRFGGNWWGNRELEWSLVNLWIEFFFSSLKGFWALLAAVLAGTFVGWRLYRKQRTWPYGVELALLIIPMMCAGVFALVMSVKIFWLIWRYFMPFVPSLYLTTALLMAPLLHKYKGAFLLVVIFLFFSFKTTWQLSQLLRKGVFFPVRTAMELYKEAFPDKELFVIAMEAFPPVSMTPMYGFYPHYYFKMDNPVTEIFQLPNPQLQAILDRQQDGVFWMPNCSPQKMERIMLRTGREAKIFARHENTCYLLFSDGKGIDSKQATAYVERFVRARKKLDGKI